MFVLLLILAHVGHTIEFSKYVTDDPSVQITYSRTRYGLSVHTRNLKVLMLEYGKAAMALGGYIVPG